MQNKLFLSYIQVLCTLLQNRSSSSGATLGPQQEKQQFTYWYIFIGYILKPLSFTQGTSMINKF